MMRTPQQYISLIALVLLFASCQSPNQILSKSDSRMKIMTSIASDHELSKEMIDAIMRGDHGKMLMHERMKTMVEDKNMMKNDPEMTKQLMSGMIATAQADTNMMSQMCKSMMNSPEMMDKMQKMKENDKMMKMQKMNPY